MFLSWNLDGDTLTSRSKCCGFLAAISQDQYYYFVLHGLIFISVSLQNACKSFAFPLISTPGTYLNSNLSLRKVPVFEDFLVCVFPHLDWIRKNTNQKNSKYGHFSRSVYDAALIGGRSSKYGDTLFKVRGIIHLKFLNLVIFSFRITVITTIWYIILYIPELPVIFKFS